MMLEEKISPAIRRDAIEALAARRGYYIPPGAWPDGGWIEDLDVSGRSFQRTIMEAVSHVESGLAKAILVWKYSRLGRNRTGNQLNLARVETAGGELLSATEEVDASTAVGKLTRGMLMELAAFETTDLVSSGLRRTTTASPAACRRSALSTSGTCAEAGSLIRWIRSARCETPPMAKNATYPTSAPERQRHQLAATRQYGGSEFRLPGPQAQPGWVHLRGWSAVERRDSSPGHGSGVRCRPAPHP
ncbi:recombinase family protein [Nonomuraea sp. NPDC001699]